MIFKGYMKLFLDANNEAELMAKSEFTGHWLTRRYKIMKKPRRYKVNIYMYNIAGELAHTEVQMVEAGTSEHLWRAVVDYAKAIMDEYPEELFDRDKSNAVVRA